MENKVCRFTYIKNIQVNFVDLKSKFIPGQVYGGNDTTIVTANFGVLHHINIL
jgi:hypothetical protein